jgi:hypothetical protein
MGLKKLWIVGVINIVFVVFVFIFAQDVVDKGRQYNKNMHEHVQVLTFKDRILNQDEWVMLITGKVISSVEDKVWIQKKISSELKLKDAEENYQEAKDLASYIIYIMIGLILVTVILYAGTKQILLALGGSLVSTSLVLLYLGVLSPLIEIHAYDEDLKIPIVIKLDEMAEVGDEYINKGSEYLEEWSEYLGYKMDIPTYSPLSWLIDGYQYDHSVVFEGKMYYYFQSKSVDSIIDLLFKDKNYAVAWSLLCFSIIFPLFKIILTLLLIYIPKLRTIPAFAMVLSIIGKWSMADIFVAAVFLAYFSFHNMNAGIETSSQSLMGLDFFLGYAIISIIASILVWAATKKETQMKLYESAF